MGKHFFVIHNTDFCFFFHENISNCKIIAVDTDLVVDFVATAESRDRKS